jgi:hypothetical protein
MKGNNNKRMICGTSVIEVTTKEDNMKKIVVILLGLAFAVNAYALELKFQIDDAKVPRIIEAMAGLYPIPDENKDGTPDFTPAQWGKECIRRWIYTQVARYETAKARQAINVPAESDLVQ